MRQDIGKAANIDGTLHVDRYLTNFSVGYIQEQRNFVAQRASSVIPVQRASDKYIIYDRGYFWRDNVKPRPLGGRPEQAGYKYTDGTYLAVEYALEHTIDDRQRANADAPLQLDQNATKLLSQQHMIKQDRFWAQNLFATGKWTNEVTGIQSGPSATQFTQFNDVSADSDPIAVIDQWKDTMAEATGFMPNTLVLGSAVKRALRSHPDLRDVIKYTKGGLVDDAILASLFEVTDVVTARAVYNTAAEGQTNSFSFIADKYSFWLGYIEKNPSLDTPTAIATFAWTGLLPGQTNALGGVMERGRDDRAHSDYFQMRSAWDVVKVADDLGVFFKDAVAH